jgi:hypothetical protein
MMFLLMMFLLVRRCGQGIVGLKDQGKINQIVYKFITHYDALFQEENEISPSNEWVNGHKSCIGYWNFMFYL